MSKESKIKVKGPVVELDGDIECAAAGSGLDQADCHRPARFWRPVPGDQLQGGQAGTVSITFTPADGSQPIVHEMVSIPEDGSVVMGMYNHRLIDDTVAACLK
jgi:hypothetical protein